MRLLTILIFFLSGITHADELTLKRGKDYVVPNGKVWLIQKVPVADCGVCTADIYIKGAISNVEVAGITFHGNFDFSFSDKTHSKIKLYPGTEIEFGDVRETLTVNEQSM